MGSSINDRFHKRIDSKKFEKFVADSGLTRADICRRAATNDNEVYAAIKKGACRITVMNAFCEVLGVPRDYFDYVEPVVEEVEENADEDESSYSNHELLLQILLSNRKQEALMLELLNCWKTEK